MSIQPSYILSAKWLGIIIPLISVSIILLPFGLSAYSIWERRQRAKPIPRPNHNPTDEIYHYRPALISRNQRIHLAVPFALKLLFLPFYLYGLGLKILIGICIYPLSIVSRGSTTSLDRIAFIDQLREQQSSLIVHSIFIEMPNQSRLFTCEFTPKNLTDERQAPHIITLWGNLDEFGNHISDISRMITCLNARVIGFHHSNFGFSGIPTQIGTPRPIYPRDQSELVLEGIAQVQRLLDKGIPAKNITLYGHSLGAGIATLVTGYLQQQTPRKLINVYNDRSFSSISDVIINHIIPTYPQSRTPLTHRVKQPLIDLLKMTARSFVTAIVKPLLWLSHWDIDAGAVIHRLNHSSWNYSVIRKRLSQSPSTYIDDTIITYGGSIHNAPEVKMQRRHRNSTTTTPIANHCGRGNKFFPIVHTINAHTASPSVIINSAGLTAEEHFHEFVHQTIRT
jgi:pimeloyl-ACP methyl ester carboxylesterase